MDDVKDAKQLVIIGNGFDLHFGQKTKFEDYINSFCSYVNIWHKNS